MPLWSLYKRHIHLGENEVGPYQAEIQQGFEDIQPQSGELKGGYGLVCLAIDREILYDQTGFQAIPLGINAADCHLRIKLGGGVSRNILVVIPQQMGKATPGLHQHRQ